MANPANVANPANGASHPASTIVDRFSIAPPIETPLASLCTVAYLSPSFGVSQLTATTYRSYPQAK